MLFRMGLNGGTCLYWGCLKTGYWREYLDQSGRLEETACWGFS